MDDYRVRPIVGRRLMAAAVLTLGVILAVVLIALVVVGVEVLRGNVP